MCWRGFHTVRRCFSMKTSYITTPIYYVNAEPHMGHLYSSVIADAIKRWQQLIRKDAKVFLSTGTDEHGIKIQRSAKTSNTTVKDYCDYISAKYRTMTETFDISCNDFIRTSDDRHKSAVQQFWKHLSERDLIYKSTYEGWYCVPDETFLSESQLDEVVKDGQKILVSAESRHPVEWSEESNYIFKLSLFKQDLLAWLRENESAVVPKKFYKILLDLIHSEDALSDISVSRPSSRVYWGIPVPDDCDQSIYVWLDALVNYLTVAGYSHDSEQFNSLWPPDVQVIGKDILKFHGVYWPAFLMAAGLDPPKCILCHSHWTVDGEKMSKSKGNIVNPMAKLTSYTSDGLRYFLLREGVNHSDGNYSETKILRLLNAELADTLGNLLSRCCGKALNPDQTFPSINTETFDQISSLDVTVKLIANITKLPSVCERHYNDYNFYKAAEAVMTCLHSANLFFETMKPWELKKLPEKMDELRAVLHVTMEALRVTGILLQPLVPNISRNLLNKLNVPVEKRYFEDLETFSWSDKLFKSRPLSGDSSVLFRRIVPEDESRKQAKL